MPTTSYVRRLKRIFRQAHKGNWKEVYAELGDFDINAKFNGSTLGSIAVAQNDLDKLRTLVEIYGYDITKNVNGCDILYFATGNGCFDYIVSSYDKFQKRLQVDAISGEQAGGAGTSTAVTFHNSPVLSAIKHTRITHSPFEKLKALGFDLTLVSPNTQSSYIFYALKYRNNHALAPLSKFVDVNRPNAYGFTPLAHALNKGTPEQITILIENGANLAPTVQNANPTNERTAKMQRIMPPIAWVNGTSSERPRKYRALLSNKGADVNAITYPGKYTKYMWESLRGSIECMVLLYENYGANPFAADSKGMTALSWSAYSKNYGRFAYNLQLFTKEAEKRWEPFHYRELYAIKKRLYGKYYNEITEVNAQMVYDEILSPRAQDQFAESGMQTADHIPSNDQLLNIQKIYNSVSKAIDKLEECDTPSKYNSELHVKKLLRVEKKKQIRNAQS
jgi:ankyrin repeat protein